MLNSTKLQGTNINKEVYFAIVVVASSLLMGYAVATKGFYSLVPFFLLVILLVICWMKPKLYVQGLLVLSLALPTSYMTTTALSVTFGGYHVLWTDILVAILLFRWLLSLLNRHGRSKGVILSSFHWTVVALLFWASVGILRGLGQERDVRTVLYDARPLFYYSILFIITDLVHDELELNDIVKRFISGLVVYCVVALSYFVLQDAHPLSAVLSAQSAAFRNRIVFSNENYLIIAIPLVTLLLVQAQLPPFRRALLFLVLVLLVAKHLVSLGRGNTVMIILGIIFSFLVVNVTNKIMMSSLVVMWNAVISAVLLAIAISFVIYFLLPFLLGPGSTDLISTFVDRFLGLKTSRGQEVHIISRINMFRSGLNLILHAPIFGYGYGFLFDVEGWSVSLTFIDSTWVTLWIRLGLIGVILLLWLVVLCIRSLLFALRHSQFTDNVIYAHSLYISMAGGGTALLMHSLMNAWIVNSTAILPLLIIVGSIVGVTQDVSNEKNSRHL